MRRREFVTMLAATTSLTVVSPLGCRHAIRAILPWEGPPDSEGDPRLRALGYAVLASSPHNSQPWLVDLRSTDSLRLHVDPGRLLAATDPLQRQTYVGHGTFLEQLVLGAAREGDRASVNLFPDGDALGDPVAEVVFESGFTGEAPLAEGLLRRRTNKRAYRKEPLADAALDRIVEAAGASDRPDDRARVRVFAVTDAPRKQALTDLCTRAMAVEVSSRERDTELARWFRLSDAEIDAHADGISLRQSGMGGFKRWIAESFVVDREDITDPDSTFNAQAVELTRKQAEHTSAWIVIATPGNSRRDQVLAGRAHARLQLCATLEGIATHPLSQVLEEYEDMQPIFEETQALLEHPGTIQMLVRAGLADAVPPTPRRPVQDIVLADSNV